MKFFTPETAILVILSLVAAAPILGQYGVLPTQASITACAATTDGSAPDAIEKGLSRRLFI